MALARRADAGALENYVVLGNGWNAAEAPQDEVDYAVERFSMLQEYWLDRARPLSERGARPLLKYRLASGAWVDPAAAETTEILAKVTGEAPGYDRDIRMPTAEGGFMTNRLDFFLVDVVTPENRPVFRRILRESLAPLLDDEHGFDGVFFDVAGVHNATLYPDQTPAPPGGYDRIAEQQGWIEIFAGLKEDFPDALLLINGQRPWEERAPVDFTGRTLVLESGVDGIMTDSTIMTHFGTVSAWADESIADVAAILAEGRMAVIVQGFDRESPHLDAFRLWGLATYLLAAGDAPGAYMAMSQIVHDDDLPDFPEMGFPGLGAATSELTTLHGGRILERNFEQGRVVAHVQIAKPPVTYVVPPNSERLVLVGGGPFPSEGTLEWEPIEPGPVELPAPSANMPAGTALVLRIACEDLDGDGYGAHGRPSCPVPELVDCDDGDPAVHPGAAEIPGNGLDDDCDARTPPAGCGGGEPQAGR